VPFDLHGKRLKQVAQFVNGYFGKTPIRIIYLEFHEAIDAAMEYMKKSEYDWEQIWDLRPVQGGKISKWIRQDWIEYIEVQV